MTTIAINGIVHTVSDDLVRNVSDALLREVARCAAVVVSHTDDPGNAFFGPADYSEKRAEATRDGLAAQRMHASIWWHGVDEVDARWNDALLLARGRVAA